MTGSKTSGSASSCASYGIAATSLNSLCTAPIYSLLALMERATVIGRLFQRLQEGEEVGRVAIREGVEQAFGHHADFGEASAADVVLRDAAVLGVGLAEDDGVVVLRNEEAVEDVAVFEFDAEGAVAGFHG